MKKLVLVLAVLFAVAATVPALAANWYKVGSSAFTSAPNVDYNRIKFNSIMTDGSGNIYATAANVNNNGTAGGLTIYKTDGTQIDVDVNALGLPGGITKLVRGGDGAIYGLQNWYEINWAWDVGVDHRIIRIDENGGVSVITNNGNSGANNLSKAITGLTVDGDGNIVWTTSGNGDKNNILWRYNVAEGTIDNLRPNFNNGWSDADRMFNLEYVGNGWFNIINSGGSSWGQDPISATADRTGGLASNPGWGRNHLTASAYDANRNILWTGARGGSNRLILTRWLDIDPTTGIAGSEQVWHVLADADFGTNYWTSALTIADNGNAWMGFGAGNLTSDLGGARGMVVGINAETLAIYSEGIPEVGADIAGLYWENGIGYALVLNNTTGLDSVYSTVPEPGSLLALGTGLVGLFGVIRRRK